MGAGAAVVLLLIVVAVVVFVCYKKRQQQQQPSQDRKPVNVIYIPANMSERSGGSYGGPPGAPTWQHDLTEPEYE